MALWIESHTSLARHPKTLRFAKALGVSVPAAIGHLHLLWWWAIEYAPDGDLSGFDADEIAAACGWDAGPWEASDGCPADVLWTSIQRAGFVDADGHLHDWNDYAGKLIERREKDAERKRKGRETDEQKPPLISSERPQDIRRTSAGHPRDGVRTVPYPTVPINTSPKGEGAPTKKTSQSAVTPNPKPNKSGEVIALIESESVPLAMTAADHSALKRAPMTAAQVAEVYVAIARGEYGDDWTQEHLSVQTAIKAWAAYENRKTAPRPAPRSNGRVHAGTGALVEHLRLEAEKGKLHGTSEKRTSRDLGTFEIDARLPG